MTKYKDVVEQAFKGIPKLNKPKILSEYYGNNHEDSKVLIVYNNYRKRFLNNIGKKLVKHEADDKEEHRRIYEAIRESEK